MAQKNSKHVIMWTDGSGQLGPAGWAAILTYMGRIKVVGGYAPEATNNQAETMAVVTGLRALKHPANVEIRTDSQYVVYGVQRILRKSMLKTNVDYWNIAKPLILAQKSVKVVHVKGHNGNRFNELADRYANFCRETRQEIEEVYSGTDELLRQAHSWRTQLQP